MKTPFILVLLLGFPYLGSSIVTVDVIKLAYTVIEDLVEAWPTLSARVFGGDPRVMPMYREEQKLMGKVNEVMRKVHNMDRRLIDAESNTIQAVVNLPEQLRYEIRLNSFLKDISEMEFNDELFRSYVKTERKKDVRNNTTRKVLRFERHTLEDFATNVVSHRTGSVRSLMDGLHTRIMKNSKANQLHQIPGFFEMLLDNIETYSQLCNIDQSPQQLIYNMYTLVQMTQLKAYTMIQFSWMLLRTYGKGNFTVESEMLRENYMARLEEQALAVQDTLKRASTSMWRCDPRKHVEGETYAEIKKLLQGFIVNEIDINKEHSCSEDCSYYKFTKQYGCYKNNLGCSTQPVCKGNVVKCKFVDSDMWVCKAPSSSKRRYDWIEYENGRVLGTKQRCKTSVNKVDSWWRYLFWHCSYCMCYCDDSGSHVTERIFSMKAVTTNKTENKVVVGMRFVKIKKIIYLQLKEAKLASKGGIDEDSAAWVPVKEIDIHDGTTKSGEDYFELSWEQRSMDLDNLELPKGQVLTGMKFRKIGSHLNMEIEGTEFNFTTGLLKNNGERSHWIGNDNTEKTLGNPRTEVILHNPDISVRDHAASKPDSGHNQFIKFDSTDLDLDAGQTAVPFIDIQPVVPSPMVPLSGAGIFHKGNRWYGGFIALKVFTHDFTQNIESNFPKIEGSK